MLCLCRLQLVRLSIKNRGGTSEGGTMAEDERFSLKKAAIAHTVTAGRRVWQGWMCVTQRRLLVGNFWEDPRRTVLVSFSSPSEVPVSISPHWFPRSVMLVGLYVTSACTIKLLWIFMMSLKTSFSVPQVSQSGCNQNSGESPALCR